MKQSISGRTLRSALRALACGAVAISTATFGQDTDELRVAVSAELAAQDLAGAVWSTVQQDGAIAIGAAGIADMRSGRPMRAEDRVHIASVTKTLLAVGALRLVSEGRLTLDAPVADVLPDIAFDNPWAASDPVRVRHLLDHTAGLDDARFWQVFSLEADPDAPLADAFTRDPSLLRIRSRPGAHFSYSNMGFALLARVIEAITKERYEPWFERELLRPLGMNDSTFEFVSQEGEHADTRLAMGHFEDGIAHAAVPMVLRPAGQFTTTAQDMARFARFLLGDGSIAGRPFVLPELLAAIGQPDGTEAAQAGLRVGYGLGMYLRDRHGAVGQCHGGSTIGYRAMLCVFRPQQRAFFLSINADSERADYNRVDAILLDALEVKTPAAAATPASVDASAWNGFYVPSPARMEKFAWLDTVAGFVRLRATADGLHFAPFQSDAIVLEPVGGALFRAPGRNLASHALFVTPEGVRGFGTGTQSYARMPLPQLAASWVSLALGLLGLAWVLGSGIVLLVRRRFRIAHPLSIPFLGVVALVLPVPLFLRQSFLQLGDITLASVLLVVVTAALPLTMLAGLVSCWRHGAPRSIDAFALVAVLQLTIVLAFQGLLPLLLWA